MTAFSNQSRNTTSFTNQTTGPSQASPTIDEMTVAIDDAEGTIDTPKTAYTKATKHTTSFTNQTPTP